MSARHTLMVCLWAGLGSVWAQQLPSREELRKIPLNDAVVLDPVGTWGLSRWVNRPGYTDQSGILQEDGHARFVTAEQDKQAVWSRWIPIPVAVERYPILVLTYQATGLEVSGEPFLQLRMARGRPLAALRNGDLDCDGSIHEALVDLRELAGEGAIQGLQLQPHCRGPEPAVLEVFGIRFEAEGDVPPLALPEETEHTVHLVDTAGRGIVGASVTSEPDYLNLARSAKTGTDGRVTLRVREFPDGGHAMRAEKNGMGTVEFVTEAGEPLPTTLTMRRGIRYGGIVRNEQGEPVPFASVELSTTPFPSEPSYRGWSQASVLADDQGRWLTPVLWAEGNPPESQASAYPWHPDYYAGNWTWIPAADDAAMRRTELVLRQGVKLAGSVVGPAGQPVSGAELKLAKEWSEDYPEQVVSGVEGKFVFPHWARDDRLLLVRAEGFSPMALPIYLIPGMGEQTIRLVADTMIWGRVVDTEGKPLAGVHVKAERWRNFREGLWEGTTDAEGQFVWDTAPEGAVYFRFEDGEHMALRSCPLSSGDEMQTVVLPPVLCVHGTVTDAATGKPVPDCTVTPGGGYLPEDNGRQRAPYWIPVAPWQTADGRYKARFDHARPKQRMALRIEADGYLPATVHPIAADAGELKLDIKLHRGEGLACVVRLPDGTPAVGAEVYLVQPNGVLDLRRYVGQSASPKPLPLADAAGRYQFPATAGRGYLVVRHERGYLEMDARGAKAKLDIQLEPWGRLVGVSMVNSRPAPLRNVSLKPAAPPPGSDRPEVMHTLWMRTDAEGRFRFDRVPPGPGMVAGPRLSIPSHSSGLLISRQMAYAVESGKTTQVVLGGTGRPVTGKLAFPEGSRRSFGWRMGIGKLTGSDSAVFHFPIKQDGTFRVEDIPAGQYELRIDFRSLVPGDRSSDHPLLGYVEHAFAIPEMANDRSDEPLDLGMLVVRVER